jgi:NAD(P)H dehydrogenase (quinone)
MPAILKNFLDQNLTSGFAFSYKNKKPQGLLKDKTARVFVTADTPPSFIPFLYFFIRNPIDRFSLMFCGIKVLSFNIFSQMNKKKNDADREKILKKVGKIFSK